MIKILSDEERQLISLEKALNEGDSEILAWMAQFSKDLKAIIHPTHQNILKEEHPSLALATLNIPENFDFKPIVGAFEKAGYRPFPVRTEYNLNNRQEMSEYIIRSVLTLYDDGATDKDLSRTQNGLIARDFLIYEKLPTSIIKASKTKTPLERLQKTMARPGIKGRN